jgi:2-succinyl-6-hydroxy-2,4-cyclohexadiene-1-carboxylate synthase
MFRSLTLIAAFPGYRSDAERAERAATDNKWSQLLRERPADEFLARWYEQSIFASDYWSADFRAAIFGARAETLRQANELAHMLEVTSASTMPSYWEFLRSTSLPLTYLAGERDPRYCRLAEEIQASNPHSTTHIIAGAGHALLAERAGEVARVIFGSH